MRRWAMGRTGPVGATLVAALSMGGCADLGAALRDGGTVATTGAIQRRPAEEVVAYVPGVGLVRGTGLALAGLAPPLGPARVVNRAVGACRKAVQAEAGKLG